MIKNTAVIIHNCGVIDALNPEFLVWYYFRLLYNFKLNKTRETNLKIFSSFLSIVPYSSIKIP